MRIKSNEIEVNGIKFRKIYDIDNSYGFKNPSNVPEWIEDLSKTTTIEADYQPWNSYDEEEPAGYICKGNPFGEGEKEYIPKGDYYYLFEYKGKKYFYIAHDYIGCDDMFEEYFEEI